MASVVITFDDGSTHSVSLSDDAKEAIRFAFNPSGLSDVNILKALSGALISAIGDIKPRKPEAVADLTIAVRHTQTASMWAVLAATKGL